MFIRKKQYHRLLDEISELREGVAAVTLNVTAIRNDETDVLFGFSSDIDELKTAIGEFADIADEQREAYKTQVKRDIGFQNMMNF